MLKEHHHTLMDWAARERQLKQRHTVPPASKQRQKHILALLGYILIRLGLFLQENYSGISVTDFDSHALRDLR